MADFAGTITKTSFAQPFGGHPGMLTFTITLTAATYASPTLNLTSIADELPLVSPTDVKDIKFNVGASAGYMVSWTPNASPTWANMGDLKLFTDTSTEATGTLTFKITATAMVFRNYAL
jgi:hypothetical protein